MILTESPTVAPEQQDNLYQLANAGRRLDNWYPPEFGWKRDHEKAVAQIVLKLVKAEINDPSTSPEEGATWKQYLPRILFAAEHHDKGLLYLGRDKRTGKDIPRDQILAIVNKKGALDNDEMEIIQRHPLTGVGVLEAAGVDDPFILALVALHHRIQGDYPKANDPELESILARLTPEELIYAKRAAPLLELADAVHAIMGPRDYDPSRDRDIAFGELHKPKVWQRSQISLAIDTCRELVSPGQRFAR